MLSKRKKIALLMLSVSLLIASSACSFNRSIIKSKVKIPVSTANSSSTTSSLLSSCDVVKEELPDTLSDDVFVHFIDVGQGDSILIMAGENNILIDAGERGTTVLNYLKANGIKKLDLVVATHPHADHIGGLISVLNNILVKEVLDPGVVHTTKTFEDYLTVIDKKEIRFTVAKAGRSYTYNNGMLLNVLHPNEKSSKHLNDSSIVIQLVYGDIKFMFSGDAEKASENEILNKKKDLKSNILKVGHHGSNTSTTKAFLNAVNPEVAIIMSGEDNRYGHPHKETLDKLNKAGVDTYKTVLNGTIVIQTNGKTYSLKAHDSASGKLKTKIYPLKLPPAKVQKAK